MNELSLHFWMAPAGGRGRFGALPGFFYKQMCGGL